MNNHIDKLKETADALGVKYSPNIGEAKLQDKIDAMEIINAEKKALTTEPKEVKKVVKKERKLTDNQVKIMKAQNLVKVRIVNMDPQNRGSNTVFSSVCNMIMDIQKVVPLNKVIALEECLVQEIENRSYIGAEPEIGNDGQPTGNFKTMSQPVYQVIRF